jgi:hypothetical protein
VFRNKHKERTKRLKQMSVWHPKEIRKTDLTELEFNVYDENPSSTLEDLEAAKEHFKKTLPLDMYLPERVRNVQVERDIDEEDEVKMKAAANKEELLKKLGGRSIRRKDIVDEFGLR